MGRRRPTETTAERLIKWPGVIGITVFFINFFQGVSSGNSFGGFVLGLMRGFFWFIVSLAVVGLVWGIKRKTSAAAADTKPAGTPTSSDFLEAQLEIDEARLDEATFAQAYAEGDGDPARVKAAYLRHRAHHLAKIRNPAIT
jgi:hypothetical protein